MALEEFVSGRHAAHPLTPTGQSLIDAVWRGRLTASIQSAAPPTDIAGDIRAAKERILNPTFDPGFWLYHMAVVRKEAGRVLIGDVVRNPANGRRFVVQSVGRALVLRELGTGQAVKTRTLRGLVPEIDERKRWAFTRFAGGRPELYEMVFAWPAAEHEARLLIFCDFLQDGGWGDEWAERAEGIRAVVEREGGHGRR